MASQRGRDAHRTMNPLMFRILAVAYPELDGRLRASQQPQGASLGEGAVAPEQEGAASHMALEGDTTESEANRGTEGEGSSTAGAGAETSNTDSSSDGSSLVVAGPSVPPASTGAVLKWSSLPSLMFLVEEQEDKGWEYLALGFHGVLVPPGVCRGGGLDCVQYSVRNLVFRLSVGGYRCGVCLYRRGSGSVKVAVYVGGFRHGRDSIFCTAGLLTVLPPL
ncbi:hypothetical protein NDU88_001128 [Pleurodeles waltl]|uniref:Uncharacterized protein n=1 Tax=Pleurodeles waltl TaxID=8319 RepID=A0AAV7LAK2_PLEWA|nr:hypothetical protein NDU88_001128 [Pleurodeles waltl]